MTNCNSPSEKEIVESLKLENNEITRPLASQASHILQDGLGARELFAPQATRADLAEARLNIEHPWQLLLVTYNDCQDGRITTWHRSRWRVCTPHCARPHKVVSRALPRLLLLPPPPPLPPRRRFPLHRPESFYRHLNQSDDRKNEFGVPGLARTGATEDSGPPWMGRLCG